jgi:tetratricopeptide (TPR) repeat protein
MSLVIIPLMHITLDSTKSVDLTKLSELDAIKLIKEAYGFLSSSLDVSLKDGLAIIELKEERADRINAAEKTYQKAIREARHGDYRKAIKSFTLALETIPNHVDARRNLAMAYLELGHVAKAKEHLEECLKLDPSNAWSFVLLGNIYAKNERNRPVAEFYYEAGLAISPNDNILLNNYAWLQLEQGNVTKARELLERAMAADSSLPNTYFGLAYLHQKNHEPAVALAILDRLFDQQKSSDIRNEPLYRNSRAMYLDLAGELASKDSKDLMELIQTKKMELERIGGYRISLEEDNSLGYISGTTQMGWKYGWDEHRIRYRMKSEAVTPHLLAHELEHISLEHDARTNGRNRFFTANTETRAAALRSVSGHATKLPRQDELVQNLIHGLCNQIFNCPLDMVVEHNLYMKHPKLRQSQLVSMDLMFQDAIRTFGDADIKKVVPPFIFRASSTLNCAYALFIDDLFHGRTNYSTVYRSSEVFSAGKNLFDIWKKRMAVFQSGDEYDLVDEFARLLKLRSWYIWKTDDGSDMNRDRLSSSNPAPITTDKPEAYMYCLDALRRFDGKSRDEIVAVASEIGILGMNGIDHTSEKTYTLMAFPNERFTGLALLCIMYVGFKLYDPSINSGLDFAEAYELAREAHKAVVH